MRTPLDVKAATPDFEESAIPFNVQRTLTIPPLVFQAPAASTTQVLFEIETIAPATGIVAQIGCVVCIKRID